MGGSTDENWRCLRNAFLSQSDEQPALLARRWPNHRLEAVHELYCVLREHSNNWVVNLFRYEYNPNSSQFWILD